MQKKGLGILFLSSLFLINFASAYNGYYGGFSLSDLLSEIDSSTMILGAILIISFAILNMSLSRVFKDNKPVAGIVSFVLALLITWGLNKSNFDIEDLLYNIGVPSEFLFALLPLIILGGFIFMFMKWRGKGLIFIGIFFILSSFVVYEKGLVVILGILFLIGGIIVLVKWPKKDGVGIRLDGNVGLR